MKHSLALLAVGLMSVMSAQAQTATDLNEGLRVTKSATTGVFTLSWWGQAGRTYFIQQSFDLLTWQYVPVVMSGAAEVTGMNFSCSDSRQFWRLRYTDQVYTGTAAAADFDYDGLSNQAELNAGLDPFNADTDGDALPDGWEVAHGLDPKSVSGVNGAQGDPDGDQLTNLQEYNYNADPQDTDTDDDNLADYAEAYVYFTAAWLVDTDYDGLDDGLEVLTRHTDPLGMDSDHDTLFDGEEVHTLGTNPMDVDTDGDWMWDDWELAKGFNPLSAADAWLDADSDGLNNLGEFCFRGSGYNPKVADATNFPWTQDPDSDGLTNQQELNTHHTNPVQSDSDGDTLEDGWEIEYGMNATVDNNTDAIQGNDAGNDPDSDSLNNEMECQLGTNPFDADTDADGVADDVEEAQASNPKNATSYAAPANGTVTVTVQIGDHSGSHSEMYEVHLTPVEGDSYGGDRTRSNIEYGTVKTHTFTLPRGAKYTVTLKHIGTAPNYRDVPNPDYDYTLELSTGTGFIQKSDPQGMLGVHDESTDFFAAGKAATLYIPDFKVKQATLGGSTIGDLQSDDKTITYSAPHWSDTNGDGDADDAGEKKYPVAFVRNTAATISGLIEVKPSGIPGLSPKVRITGSNSVNLSATDATFASNQITLAPTSSSAFTNKIDHHDPMTLSWEVSPDGGSTWVNAGNTKNRVYVTLATPTTTKRQETIFDLGSRNAKGETTEAAAFAKIWADFKAPAGGGIPEITRVLPSGQSGRTAALTYYANSAKPYDNTPRTLDDLLSTGDGRCGTFQELMMRVLAVQGIPVSSEDVRAPLMGITQAVADYTATYGGDPLSIYHIVSVFFVKNWTLNMANRWGSTDLTGVAGQGNSNPIAAFEDHALVKYDGKFYDPSYGTGPFNSLIEWEDGSVEGFGVQFIHPNGQAAQFKYWLRSIDVKGTQETTP